MPRLQLISPVDGSVYAERPAAGPQDLESALEQAARAQARWRAEALGRRQEIVAGAFRRLEERAQDLAVELAWQMGRPIAYGPGELTRARQRADYMCEAAGPALAPQAPGAGGSILREPVGTVLVIAPWNYPYLTVTNSVVPALVAGNSVILKPSFQAALAAEAFARAFDEAGLPPGLLQVLHADDPTTMAAVAHPAVGHVVFTGSVRVGLLVARAAAERLTPVTLELGGKDAAYVREDADLDALLPEIADGAFFNSGQSCCAIERIYVQRSRFDEFTARLAEAARVLRLGSPLEPGTTLGPLARASAADSLRRQIQDAIAAGARPLLDHAAPPPGPAYVFPQVLVDVDHGMSVMRDESFGPVVGVMPVDGDEDAVDRINDSPFGLTASVWTSDRQAALRLTPALDCGTVYWNRCDYLDPALPWSGRKASGLGLSLSHLAYGSLTRPKSVLV